MLGISSGRSGRWQQGDPDATSRDDCLDFVALCVGRCGADQGVCRDKDASITACTQILQAPSETVSDRAIAYYIRGGAYQTKGDSNNAVADYTKAIEANLRYADADRAFAYRPASILRLTLAVGSIALES